MMKESEDSTLLLQFKGSAIYPKKSINTIKKDSGASQRTPRAEP